MKHKLYVGDGAGRSALEKALQEATRYTVQYTDQPTQKDSVDEHVSIKQELLKKSLGEIVEIGTNEKGQKIYWVAVGESKNICLQAWADFWDILDDCIVNWDIIEN